MVDFKPSLYEGQWTHLLSDECDEHISYPLTLVGSVPFLTSLLGQHRHDFTISSHRSHHFLANNIENIVISQGKLLQARKGHIFYIPFKHIYIFVA